jgi:large subunit ribosomal protein L6
MSRLGKQAIELPAGVAVEVSGSDVSVKGPKGELSITVSPDIEVKVDGEAKQVVVTANGEDRQSKANHGLYRSLLQNMVTGTATGFTKTLLLEGVGYRVVLAGQKLTLSLGFCHTIDYFVNPGVKVTVDGNTTIKLESHDKQLLGQTAAEIRELRKPEPYKGKGIRYSDEVIRKKLGKAAAK